MLLHENIDMDAPLSIDKFDLLRPTGKLKALSSDQRVQPFQIWGASDFPYLVAVRDVDDRQKIKVIIQDHIKGQAEVEMTDLDFVWQLKNEVANQQRVSDPRLLLFDGHRELRDFEELREAGVTNGSILYPLWETEAGTPIGAASAGVSEVVDIDVRLPGGQSLSISCQPIMAIRQLKLELLQALTNRTGVTPTAQDIISGAVTDDISSNTNVIQLQAQLRHEKDQNESLAVRLAEVMQSCMKFLTHAPQIPSRDLPPQLPLGLPLAPQKLYALTNPQSPSAEAGGEQALWPSLQQPPLQQSGDQPLSASLSGERRAGPDLGAQLLRPQAQRALALPSSIEPVRQLQSIMPAMPDLDWAAVSSPPQVKPESRQLGFRPVGQPRVMQQHHSPVPGGDTAAEVTGLSYGLQHQRGFPAGVTYQVPPSGVVMQHLGGSGWQAQMAQPAGLGIPPAYPAHLLVHHLPAPGVPPPQANVAAAGPQLHLDHVLQLIMSVQAGAGNVVGGPQQQEGGGIAAMAAQPMPLAQLPPLHPAMLPPANIGGFPQFTSLLTALGLPGQPFQGQQLQGQHQPNLLALQHVGPQELQSLLNTEAVGPQQLPAGVPQAGGAEAATDRPTRKRRAPPDRLRSGEEVDYLARVPPKEEFEQRLRDFYATQNINYTVPVVEGGEMDFHFIFKEVAARGGYEAVVVHRLWRQIGIKWRDDLRHVTNASTLLKNKYERHLLAFERELSRGAPRKPIFSEWGKVAEEQRAMKKAREEGAAAGKLGKKRIVRPKEQHDLAVPTTISEASPATSAAEGPQTDPTRVLLGLNLTDLSLRSQPPSATTTPRPDSPRSSTQRAGDIGIFTQISSAPLGTISALQGSPGATTALASLDLSGGGQASQPVPQLPVSSGASVNVQLPAHLPQVPDPGSGNF